MTRYKICVRVLQGQILTFHVNSYKIIDGDFVQFQDEMTSSIRQFHASNCEITEVKI